MLRSSWSLNIYSLNENVSLLLQAPVPALLQLSYISYCLCRLPELTLVIFFQDRTEVPCFLILQSVSDMYDGIHNSQGKPVDKGREL